MVRRCDWYVILIYITIYSFMRGFGLPLLKAREEEGTMGSNLLLVRNYNFKSQFTLLCGFSGPLVKGPRRVDDGDEWSGRWR